MGSILHDNTTKGLRESGSFEILWIFRLHAYGVTLIMQKVS